MIEAAILPNRGLVRIVGKDRAAFLQGLITKDVHKITPTQAVYGALLSPQGKFQYDFFVGSFRGSGKNADGEDAWLMECDLDRADALIQRLSAYKLRSEVALENAAGRFSVSVCWESAGDFPVDFPTEFGQDAPQDSSQRPSRKLPALISDLPFKEGAAKPEEGGCAFVDPRLRELGVRVILPHDKTTNFYKSRGVALTSFEAYDLHRLTLGVPDGRRDIPMDRGILLECGFDELNGIDWDKGCYMGQELTARTRYRGLVRKRLIPFRIQGEPPPFQAPILQEGAEVGDMRTFRKGWGIGMIRLEALSKSLPFQCENAVLTPYVPYWMRLPSLA